MTGANTALALAGAVAVSEAAGFTSFTPVGSGSGEEQQLQMPGTPAAPAMDLSGFGEALGAAMRAGQTVGGSGGGSGLDAGEVAALIGASRTPMEVTRDPFADLREDIRQRNLPGPDTKDDGGEPDPAGYVADQGTTLFGDPSRPDRTGGAIGFAYNSGDLLGQAVDKTKDRFGRGFERGRKDGEAVRDLVGSGVENFRSAKEKGRKDPNSGPVMRMGLGGDDSVTTTVPTSDPEPEWGTSTSPGFSGEVPGGASTSSDEEEREKRIPTTTPTSASAFRGGR